MDFDEEFRGCLSRVVLPLERCYWPLFAVGPFDDLVELLERGRFCRNIDYDHEPIDLSDCALRPFKRFAMRGRLNIRIRTFRYDLELNVVEPYEFEYLHRDSRRYAAVLIELTPERVEVTLVVFAVKDEFLGTSKLALTTLIHRLLFREILRLDDCDLLLNQLLLLILSPFGFFEFFIDRLLETRRIAASGVDILVAPGDA